MRLAPLEIVLYNSNLIRNCFIAVLVSYQRHLVFINVIFVFLVIETFLQQYINTGLWYDHYNSARIHPTGSMRLLVRSSRFYQKIGERSRLQKLSERAFQNLRGVFYRRNSNCSY